MINKGMATMGNIVARPSSETTPAKRGFAATRTPLGSVGVAIPRWGRISEPAFSESKHQLQGGRLGEPAPPFDQHVGLFAATVRQAAAIAAGCGLALSGWAAPWSSPVVDLGAAAAARSTAVPLDGWRVDWPAFFQKDFTLYTRFRPRGERWAEGTIFSWRQLVDGKNVGAVLGVQPLNRDSLRMLYFFVDVTTADLGDKTAPERMQLSRMAFIMMPLWPEVEPFAEQGWHEVVIRARHPHLEIFVDGVVRAKKLFASCPIVKGDTVFPREIHGERHWTAVGGEEDGQRRFPGDIGAFRVWDRALADEEVKNLSGGVFQGNYDRPFGWNQLGLFPNEWSYERRKAWLDGKNRRMHHDLINHEPFYPRFHPTLLADTYNHSTLFAKGKYHLFPYFGWGYWNAFPIWDNWAFGHLISEDGVHWKMVEQVWKLPSINGTFYEERKSGVVYGLLGWAGPDFTRFSQEKAVNVIRAEDDDLVNWRRDEKSPLVLPQPEGWVGGDCDVFEREGRYYLIATAKNGTSTEARREQIMLYESEDLRQWRYQGVFYTGKRGGATEAPHIFPLGGKLILNGCHRIDLDAQYLIGTLRGGQFKPDIARGTQRDRWMWNWATAKVSRFAPTFWTVLDEKGRRVAHQWLYFNAYQFKYGIRESMKRGWNGSSYSLAQEVKLLPDGSAGLLPIEEYASLRKMGTRQTVSAMPGKATPTLTAPAWLDVVARWRGRGEVVALVLTKGGEEVRVVYEDARAEVKVDARKARNAFVQDGVAPVQFEGTEKEIRCLLDGGLTEIYVAGRFFGFRWFTDEPGEVRIRFERADDQARLVSLDVWEMGSCWVE